MGEGAIESGSGGAAVSTPGKSRCRRREPGGDRPDAGRWRHTARGEPGAAALVAAAVALAVWRQSAAEAVAVAIIIAVATRRWAFGVAMGALTLFAVAQGVDAQREIAPDRLGPFTGWATVVDDPQPAGPATRVIVQIEGERFEVWIRGRAARIRLDTWRGGDRVWLAGERRGLDDARARRVAWQHVVGAFAADTLGDRRDGRPLAFSANRVRRAVADATAALPAHDAALARGLIIGDDSDQPREMVERFRLTGLAHLTAVSGQNVALVLAAAGPLLCRARPMPRLVATLALIGWFVVVTRAEPSVLRAGAMAGLGSVAFAFGREREPPRLLAVAVIALLLIDPLLVLSVGFWLSVGATAGVTVIGPPLARRLRRIGRMALPVAITLGAQLGVAIPSLLVFGRLSLVGVVANLVAVPVAGFVMLYGLPACLVAGALPFGASVVMLPVGVGVRIVDVIATAAAAVEPPVAVSVAGWCVIGVAVVILFRRSTGDEPSDSAGQLRQ